MKEKKRNERKGKESGEEPFFHGVNHIDLPKESFF